MKRGAAHTPLLLFSGPRGAGARTGAAHAPGGTTTSSRLAGCTAHILGTAWVTVHSPWGYVPMHSTQVARGARLEGREGVSRRGVWLTLWPAPRRCDGPLGSIIGAAPMAAPAVPCDPALGRRHM
eukprot:1941239-Prymnesium_polylepis.1